MRNNFFDFNCCNYTNRYIRCPYCGGYRNPTCGMRGIVGPQGPRGATGPQGPQGADGVSPTLATSLSTYTGTIATASLVPLTEALNTSTGEITLNATANTITLTPGVYYLTYSGVATGVAGDVELSIYIGGAQATNTISSDTLATATDSSTLTGATVINATTNTVVDLRNSGTNEFTIKNLSFIITKLS